MINIYFCFPIYWWCKNVYNYMYRPQMTVFVGWNCSFFFMSVGREHSWFFSLISFLRRAMCQCGYLLIKEVVTIGHFKYRSDYVTHHYDQKSYKELAWSTYIQFSFLRKSPWFCISDCYFIYFISKEQRDRNTMWLWYQYITVICNTWLMLTRFILSL